MAGRLRWGIMGTGNIARQFAEGLAGAARGGAIAVGSRKKQTATDFARTYGVGRSYGNYDDLLADRDVDAIYLTLPNAMHCEWTIKALRAGKHVLCEKPLARDAAESEEMFDEAEKQGLLVMEAFMYRCHPLTLAVKEKIQNGAVGRLVMIRTSFCYCTRKIGNNIRFNQALAGGGLMDVGCYCVNFSRYFAGGEPSAVQAVAHMHESGIDDFAAGTLWFDNGLVASFTCGMTLHADNTAHLCGSDGYMEVPVPWKPPVVGANYLLKRSIPPRQDEPTHPSVPAAQSIEVDTGGKPIFAIEADHFVASILDGSPPRLSREDTIGNMRVLDEMRRQIRLVF